jgi:hypothetical protein
MQEHLGKLILDIGSKVLEEILHIKIGISSLKEKGKSALLVAGNARWDKEGKEVIRIASLAALSSMQT